MLFVVKELSIWIIAIAQEEDLVEDVAILCEHELANAWRAGFGVLLPLHHRVIWPENGNYKTEAEEDEHLQSLGISSIFAMRSAIRELLLLRLDSNVAVWRYSVEVIQMFRFYYNIKFLGAYCHSAIGVIYLQDQRPVQPR